MATKLKNLNIHKVDFVDQGANPDAHILLFKNRGGKNGREGGRKENGFWKHLVSVIRETTEMGQKEFDSAIEGVQKVKSVSFNEKLNETKSRKVSDEIWDLCYALQAAICSILTDERLDSTSAAVAMKESLEEFQAVMEESVVNWATGNIAGIIRKDDSVSEVELEIMKAAAQRLEEFIWKVESAPEEVNKEELEGEEKEMKIDKSKLTPAELAFLESIEKRCGTEEAENAGNASVVQTQQTVEPQITAPAQRMQEDLVAKSILPVETVVQEAFVAVPVQTQSVNEDIYKGLHPAVKAELEELKKFREDTEERELTEIAKKYAIIGKKVEELVPMLKGLKAAGGSAYEDMIAVLDQAVDTVEKSGVFSEIGKSGGRGADENSAEAKIYGIAKGYMEKDPTLSYESAVAKAWEDNPDIMDEYEKAAGF